MAIAGVCEYVGRSRWCKVEAQDRAQGAMARGIYISSHLDSWDSWVIKGLSQLSNPSCPRIEKGTAFRYLSRFPSPWHRRSIMRIPSALKTQSSRYRSHGKSKHIRLHLSLTPNLPFPLSMISHRLRPTRYCLLRPSPLLIRRRMPSPHRWPMGAAMSRSRDSVWMLRP